MLIRIGSNGFWARRDSPSESLEETARMFNEINGQIIVEIGSGVHGRLAGNSVLTWAKKTRAKRIITVDLDPKQIDDVKKATIKYKNVEPIVADGLKYLADFSSSIDLLYLDFWVPDPDGALPGTGRAEAYRAAFAAAKNKLADRSLILIDDTDHVHPWKHTLIIPDARKDGFVVIFVGRQTLLMRNAPATATR
ncbi:MAG TPA: class I SAM-dependent methyltransferase [Chthoniobacterales bacterium]|jgi:predicted O-methyltransferase YrrM|nr:class I SAM-dependent methyltransferase [Chthoniobacterales bacterium]